LQAPPGASRLGLDKLAAIKERERREAEAAAARKRQLEEEEGGEGATPSRGGKFIRKEVKDKEFRWDGRRFPFLNSIFVCPLLFTKKNRQVTRTWF
jgi:hypothetical protein